MISIYIPAVILMGVLGGILYIEGCRNIKAATPPWGDKVSNLAQALSYRWRAQMAQAGEIKKAVGMTLCLIGLLLALLAYFKHI